MTQTLSLRNALWLTASFALVAVPHGERLPWWVTLICTALIVWRIYLARTRLTLPPRAVLMLIVVGATAGVYVQFGTIFGRDAGVALLVVMLALKLLEMRTTRDAMLLNFLAYFLVITNFLYSQTIPTALYMLACVWFITAGMIGIHYTRPPAGTAPQMRSAGALLVQSLPLMLVLFVLFPRVEGPLWGMPADAQRGTTGLTDTMSPGTLSSLTLSEAVAFRAAFKSGMPEPKQLYWRGPVLWDYDGRTWRAGRPHHAPPSYESRSLPVEYTVTVEPHGKMWLFALDLPGLVPPRATMNADFQIVSVQPVTSRVRYDMRSFANYRYGSSDSETFLERALKLPDGFNPRTLALGRELRRKLGTDRAVIQAALNLFNREAFRYTLSPPPLGQHAVDDFLFRTRNGFCEHYASAFTVLMRAAGIPARVVTGYQGGEPNPLGNYMIVRQADAHAWTEVWLRGEGWVRTDPTAAVSPERVEQGITALETSGALPLFMRNDFPLLRGLRLTWDSVANSWNQWVLGYTPERQRGLLMRVGLDDATWHTLAALLLTATGLITLILAIITLRRLGIRVRDPVRLAYAAFCEKLGRRGLPRDPAEGPLAYADRVVRARPDLDAAVRCFIGVYVGLRYGDDAGTDKTSLLRKLAREFKP
ncbi:MAG: transglutaminase domain protein [Ramlibacter sp.]|nr:transglutaminase domain protein [Ramlibacter sp.]